MLRHATLRDRSRMREAARLMGHTTLHRGEVMLGGESLNRVPVFRRARHGIGFVPQEREVSLR